ncbi:transferase, Chloramphenicol acetyltransferase-like domain protein [Artemisia annua]|uniref:Transferase, Chloramphenicol acetyltransferase-like domain protein n=1 Tax=Artemisia annua TaxID=35608 RepID=A0A2U1KQI1_ARTAN|nr:transferase, Chloramphenicol acetyltransferase-like domain protein [Artemisia annua]
MATLISLNGNYSQKGLLFAKPTPTENQDFSISTFLDDLRWSLSATLDHFYPLAARLATRKQENPPSYVVYIDPENCQGVKFVHTTVDATVADIVASKDAHILAHSFFDLKNAINHDGHTLPLLSIQVTELTDVSATTTVEELMAHGLGWAALKLHEAVKNHDDRAVKKFVESWLRNPIVYKLSGLFHPNLVHFGSLPRFDMYGCEFGLGKALAARSGIMNKADGKMTMFHGRVASCVGLKIFAPV